MNVIVMVLHGMDRNAFVAREMTFLLARLMVRLLFSAKSKSWATPNPFAQIVSRRDISTITTTGYVLQLFAVRDVLAETVIDLYFREHKATFSLAS